MQRGNLIASVPLVGCIVEKSKRFAGKFVFTLRWRSTLVSDKIYYLQTDTEDTLNKYLTTLDKVIQEANGEFIEEEKEIEKLEKLDTSVLDKSFNTQLQDLIRKRKALIYEDLVPNNMSSLITRAQFGDWSAKRIGKLLKNIGPLNVTHSSTLFDILKHESEKFRRKGQKCPPEFVTLYSRLYSFFEAQSASSYEQYSQINILVDRMNQLQEYGEKKLPDIIKEESILAKNMNQYNTTLELAEAKAIRLLKRHMGDENVGKSLSSMFASKDGVKKNMKNQ